MEFTASLQKLAAYQPRPNQKSKEFLAKAPTVLAGLSGSPQDSESTRSHMFNLVKQCS